MEKLVIRKRTAEEIALWKVPCVGITPNTVIEIDAGLTLLIKVEGENKITSKSSVTIYSLLNPGKTNKLIGGKKPYDSCEIYAIDIASEFKSEWGLAGPAAIPCRDYEFDVDAKAVAFGQYFYKIEDFFAFVACLPMDASNQVTRDNVREYLRAQTAGIVSSYLSAKIAGRDIRECQARVADFSGDIMYQLNRHFDSKGIKVNTFLVSSLDFEPAHKANRERLKEAKVDVKINEVVNEGRRDDISVLKELSEIEVALINAEKGNSGNRANNNTNNNQLPENSTTYCPRCGTANTNGNYCTKCGEPLKKNIKN